MSYLKIKNMSMPESCLNCPLSILDNYGYRHCFVTEYNVTDECEYKERHHHCPLEEIEGD